MQFLPVEKAASFKRSGLSEIASGYFIPFTTANLKTLLNLNAML